MTISIYLKEDIRQHQCKVRYRSDAFRKRFFFLVQNGIKRYRRGISEALKEAGTKVLGFVNTTPIGILKRSFISPVRPSVHTHPEKLSTENGAFRKRS